MSSKLHRLMKMKLGVGARQMKGGRNAELDDLACGVMVYVVREGRKVMALYRGTQGICHIKRTSYSHMQAVC